MDFYQRISALLNSPAGNIAYHTALSISIAGALYSAFKIWRRRKSPQGYRMLIGLSFLLIVRILMFVGSATQGMNDAQTIPILPVLNKAADILGLIFIFWLWGFPEPHKFADPWVTAFSLMTLSLVLVHTFVEPSHTASIVIGLSWIDLAWLGLGGLLILLGTGLLIQRRPNGWEYGLGMAFVLSLGYILSFLNPELSTRHSGQIRLAQMASYPLLMALPFRFALTKTRPGQEAPKPRGEAGRRRSTIDLSVLKAILDFSPRSEPKKLYQNIVKLTSYAIVADICLLVEAPDPRGDVDVLSGFDLIRQEVIPGFKIESDRIPLLSTFIRREQTLNLPASSTSRDLINLSHILQLRKSGHLLATPIKVTEGETLKGLVLLSPFSDRQWIKEDQAFLNDLIEIITSNLAHESTPELPLERLKHGYMRLKEKYEEEREKNQTLRTKLKQLKEKVHQAQVQENAVTQEAMNKLRLDNKALKEKTERLAKIAFADSEGQLRSQLKLALEEISTLKEDLARAEGKLKTLQRKDWEESALTPVQEDALTTFAQEIQELLQSLLRDSDLLLDQSIHTLNDIQYKMLQRMKDHKEQIEKLLRGTMPGLAVAPQPREPERYPADFKRSLHYSLKAIKEQIQGKEVSLQFDLPKRLLPVDMPQDVLNDITVILLANAIHESPPTGVVRLKLRMYREEAEQSFAHIQVTDQGEGFLKSELPYVIEHRAAQEDTGPVQDQKIKLDLASVRDLVEEYEGRFWVESQPGQGTTISSLLPFVPRKRIENTSSSE